MDILSRFGRSSHRFARTEYRRCRRMILFQ